MCIPGRSPRPAPLISLPCSHPTVSPPVGPNSCPLRPQGSSCVFFLQSWRNLPVFSHNIPGARAAGLWGTGRRGGDAPGTFPQGFPAPSLGARKSRHLCPRWKRQGRQQIFALRDLWSVKNQDFFSPTWKKESALQSRGPLPEQPFPEGELSSNSPPGLPQSKNYICWQRVTIPTQSKTR